MTARPLLSPPPLQAHTRWVRVTFDGVTISVTRRLNPLPRSRTARYPLADVTAAEFAWCGGEGEFRQFELRLLRRGPTLRIGVRIGDRHQRDIPWEVLAETINEASGQRMRHILRASVGLGPWSEAVWQQVEARTPELQVFAEPYYDDRTRQWGEATGHREMVARQVLQALSKDGIDAVPCPYPPPPEPGYPPHQSTWRGFQFRDSERAEQWRSEAWFEFLDRIQLGPEVTGTAVWAEDASALLAWGHHLHACRSHRR
ncbi:hypothetical protein F1D05_04480 [Kribbella qitaiheensis]|uniref:Uncharacterized protein n=1 Tax=Kribbella qitaiheensis TaxID=1544730 RepID=A0A7G6WTJ6_9ACTN|nr:hypothetical protein [Kribbella qitaiheensis]QNE17311.1 hypothetical protein F1D05_04480 [Kribbella qitaiheensis]